MISSMTTVAGDFAELGDLVWEAVTLETLLDERGIDYHGNYRDPRDIGVADLDENVFWVRFTHDLAGLVIHEYHRWYIGDSGSVCRVYRIRGEESIHG